MSTSKKFRLFISSTFNDFRQERKVLQTKVFPLIKEYASKVGYVFQPIDLRWGVSNEAQYDQKTLELCLNEVRACKTTMHPNFLIMLGDRYGWVPLPYAIEQNEFEEILNYYLKFNKNFLKIQNYPIQIALLKEWYKLDKNQLPTSYILKERTGDYEDYDTWVEVETKLRTILQSAVDKFDLKKEEKRKYFLSATEAEVEEGIIPYLNPTIFQKKVLLKDNGKLLQVDPQHIFGFFRDVDKTTQIENKFIEGDYVAAQDFKERVKKELLDTNILHTKTTQIDKETLNEAYLEAFEKEMIKFLEAQVDAQKAKETEANLTPLELETQAQAHFVQEKRKNFLVTQPLKELLSDIQTYRTNDTKEPLVIYGPSGRGKSSLIAKAIEESSESTENKVLYRFIGATPHSSSSKEILTSIFDELGIEVRNDKEREKSTGDIENLSLASNEEQESFEDFSYRVHSLLMNLKENVTIFIDAVDQLQHEDQFLWLPNNLPLNVKIIISTLDDENYKEDSKYFTTLQKKTSNTKLLPPFSEPLALLSKILEQENRTITQSQETYFLKQFNSANSALYVSVAAQEIKNWKSTDEVDKDEAQNLALTNKGIIKEFISNLSKVYHHEKRFVQKVLGYIYASRDGLSENELLELLSVDKEFVKLMADEKFHKNHTLELPLVHWTRLHTQLKPFLSSKTQDGEELMYFFHREFEDVIKEQDKQREEHEEIIRNTQELILKHKNQDFNANRWGKLYVTLIVEYELNNQDKEKQIEYALFISGLKNETIIKKYIRYIEKITSNYNLSNTKVIIYREIPYYFTKELYKENPAQWEETYTRALGNLAFYYYKQYRINDAIALEEESLAIQKELYKENLAQCSASYTGELSNLSTSYDKQNRIDEEIVVEEILLEIQKELYIENPGQYAEAYTMVLGNLAFSYKKQNRIDEAIALLEESLQIRKELYAENPLQWELAYTRALGNLVFYYYKQNRSDKSIV